MQKLIWTVRGALNKAGYDKGFERDIRAESLILMNIFIIFSDCIISVVPFLLTLNFWHPDGPAVLFSRFFCALMVGFSFFLLFRGKLEAASFVSILSIVVEGLTFFLFGTDTGIHGAYRYYFIFSIVVIMSLIFFRQKRYFIALEVLIALSQGVVWFVLFRREGTLAPSDPDALFTLTRIFFFTVFLLLGMTILRLVYQKIIKRMEESNHYLEELAFQDSLTGLANANRIRAILNEEIGIAEKEKQRVVLVGIDLKNFAKVNRTYGSESGDQILRMTGARMAALFPGEAAGRLTGSTFLGISRALSDIQSDVDSALEHIVAVLSSPVTIGINRFLPSIQAALTFYPQDGDTGSQLVSNIMNLLYAHRDKVCADIIRFNQAQYADLHRKIKIEESIIPSLEKGEFSFVYQPKFRIKDSAFTGMESLARWKHPELGMISPVEFIPAVEQGGHMERFTEYCFQKAAEDRQLLGSVLPADARIAVNISSLLFHRNWTSHFLREGARERRLDPKLFELEITESIFVGNEREVIDQVNSLAELGFDLSIDDFGTGYSNLRYLQRFHVQHLKIDKEFVTSMVTSEENMEIVRALVLMAHALGIKTIAEGVEYQEQADILRNLGCDQIQGYLYAKPMDTTTLKEFLRKNQDSVGSKNGKRS